MNDSTTAKRLITALGIGLLVLTLPACHSAGTLDASQVGASSRTAYRPVQTSIRGRAFYVSGYGGADYSPNRPRRNAPVGGVPAYTAPVPTTNAPEVTIRQGTWEDP